MMKVVYRWWQAIQRQDYKGAAEFWPTTPKALAVSLSRKSEGPSDIFVKRIYGDNILGSIYRISEKGGNHILDVGYQDSDSLPGLVSPQTILRRHMSSAWFRWKYNYITFVIEKDKIFSKSVIYRITDSVKRITSFNVETTRPITYYVPTRRTLEKFHQMESRGSKCRFHRRWSWMDPFGGNILSQDPTDIHELVHGFSNSFDGWPPLLIREGFAECFASPFDWKQWVSLEQYPKISRIWMEPPDAVPGWYTASALLVTMIYMHLNKNITLFWNQLTQHTTVQHLARLLEMPVSMLERQYEEWCKKSIDFIRNGSFGGLLKWGTQYNARCRIPHND